MSGRKAPAKPTISPVVVVRELTERTSLGVSGAPVTQEQSNESAHKCYEGDDKALLKNILKMGTKVMNWKIQHHSWINLQIQ